MTEPTPTPPKDQIPRWQSEVEEILEQSDRESTSFEKARAAAIATRYKAPDLAKRETGQLNSRLGDGVWLILAVVFGISAWLAGIHWAVAGRFLAIVSLFFFIGFLVNAVIRSRASQSTTKRWRGKEFRSDESPPWPPGGRGSRDDDDGPPLAGSGR